MTTYNQKINSAKRNHSRLFQLCVITATLYSEKVFVVKKKKKNLLTVDFAGEFTGVATTCIPARAGARRACIRTCSLTRFTGRLCARITC